MFGFSLTNLRTCLVSLTVVTTLPFLGLTLYTGFEEQELAGLGARAEALRLVRMVASEHEHFFGGVQRFLAEMARLPEVLGGGRDACGAVLAALWKDHPQFNDLGAADAAGNVFCGARSFQDGLSVADRPWFQRAVATGRFAVGDYQIGRVTGKPGVAFARPVLDGSGRTRAVVYAIFDLSWFNDLAARANLPKGAAFTVRDRNGTVLARYPDPDKWVGKTAPDADILKTMLAAKGEGTAEAVGVDGVRRLYAFTPLGSEPDHGIFLSMGIPEELAYANVQRVMSRNLMGLGLVALLTLLAAWFGGSFLLLSHVRVLLGATKRLSAGDLSARTGLRHGRGELQQLGRAFDEMAASIQTLTEQLHRAEARYRTLVEQIPATLYIVSATEDYRTRYISPQVEDMLGFTPREWIEDPELWVKQLFDEDRGRVLAEHYRSRSEGSAFSSEYRMLHRDGRVVWVRDEAAAIRDETGNGIILQGIMRDVTERKRSEKALRESEAKFRALIENIPAAVVILNGEKFTYANPAAQNMSGYTKQELLDVRFLEIVHPDFQELMKERAAALLRNELVLPRDEIKIVTREGGERWVDLTAILIHCLDHPAVLTVAFDVTERKETEEVVKSLSRQNELILKAVGDSIFGLDLNGCTTFVNPAVERMTGWTAEELIGKPMHAIVHHSRADGAPYPEEECSSFATLTTGMAHHHDTEVLWKKDGGCFPADYASTPMRDEAGMLLGTVVVCKDISERRRAEEERLRLATAVEQSAESITITDTHGIMRYVNPAFERITGYSRAEVIGSHPRFLKSGRHSPEFYREIRDTVTRGNVWKGRMLYKKRDGALLDVETTISPIRDHWGAIINHVAMQRDVTYESRLEKQLRQAQKMEAIGTLAGGIAHDFNNILGAVLGYTELALYKIPPESPVRRDLDQVFKAGNRAKDLVKQILAFSRPSREERSPVQISPQVKEAVKLLRASLPSTIEIRLQLSVQPGEDVVLSNPTQIHQIVMNLCTNAAHAMREKGGVLTIGLDTVHMEAHAVKASPEPPLSPAEYAWGIEHSAPGRCVRLTMSDSGHGMERGVMERIFDPFFTTKGPGEGTGMGLAVIHGIVKSHGGEIDVRSEPGRGTTFHVLLPGVDRATGQSSEPVSEAAIPGGDERILFVDDEQTVLHALTEHLRHLGYQVTAVTKSMEALDVFRARPHDFDLVITDQTMPSLTGVELSRELTAIRPDIPIILCTGYSQAITPENAKKLGIREFFMKPVVVSEFAGAIRRVLESAP